jgi:predicted Zn-dependent peptidase
MRKDPESYRAEFVLARQKVLESLVIEGTDSATIANRLAVLARFGLPDYFYDKLAADVARLTLSDLHAFLLRELPLENQVFGAFGGAEAVDAAHRAFTHSKR